jgi:flagellar protein FliO/FliZ
VCVLQGHAIAQSTRPAVSTADQTAESQVLRITDSDVQAATARPGAGSTVASSSGDLIRLVIALAAVIGLILLLRAGYRRLSGAGLGGTGKLVTVLSRSFISPKQQVLVLEVGKRLLVVGDSGGHMSSLCEITDPDEIAALIGRSRATSAAKAKTAFAGVFRKANESFDDQAVVEEPSEEATAPDDAVSTEEIGGLLDKVRLLQQQFNDAKQVTIGNANAP